MKSPKVMKTVNRTRASEEKMKEGIDSIVFNQSTSRVRVPVDELESARWFPARVTFKALRTGHCTQQGARQRVGGLRRCRGFHCGAEHS
jgi:hypothetical protein